MKKINWDKEYAHKNYCGWCIDVTCVCDGNCFSENHVGYEENRKDHLLREKEIVENRIEAINNELKNIK